MIEVTCNATQCRNWAVAFTTRAENPEPWPMSELDPLGGSWPVEPLWYACREHAGPHHHVLDELRERQPAPVCECCGVTGAIEWTTSGPAYDEKVSVWDWIRYGPQGPPSSNRAHPFCKDCADDYNSYWDEMWKDYRSTIGV